MQVRGVYMEIIDEVAIHMRQTFLDEGVDEQVLLDLKRKWAENLEESGALVPRENPLAAQTTTADADPNTTTTTTTSAAAPAADTAAPTANAAAAAAATRGAFYPHASASAAAATTTTTATTTTAEQVSALEARAPESYGGFKQADNEVAAVAAALPQTDGADGGDGSSAEAGGGEIIGSRDEATSSEEESSEEEEEDEESTNYIICQWERIRKRTTHKWGASLSSGIMHLNGKDFMFNKCLGEYTW